MNMKQFNDQKEFDKVLKSYNSIDVNKSDEKEMYSNIMLGINKLNKRKERSNFIKPILSTIVLLMFLIPGGYLLFNQVILVDDINQMNENESNTTKHKEIEKIAEEVLGVNIIIPEHQKYVIGTSAIGFGRDMSNIEELVRGDPNNISVEYFIETDDRMDFTEEMIAEVENMNLVEFIHNEQFNASSIISLSVNLNLYTELPHQDEIEIEGHSVNFGFLEQSDYDIALFYIPYDDFAYEITYRLKSGSTIEDAKNFVAIIINELN